MAQDSVRVQAPAVAGDGTSYQLPTVRLRFGYLSFNEVLQSMPEYKQVQRSLNALRAKYEAEQRRAEQEFNLKYEEFLEGQHDFPETILRKRQTELKQLIERNVAFKAECREEIAKAEAEQMAPLRIRLSAALERVGLEQGLAFILNTDKDALPFIHPALGVDISQLVKQTIQIQNTVKSVIN